MQAWIMMLALATPGDVGRAPAPTADASHAAVYERCAMELAPRLVTGSLLFNAGDCLAIRVYTASPYTHVAVVVIEEDRPVVYDSMNGAGVRRQPLVDYLRSQSPDRLHVFHPQRPLTPEQSRGLRDYLDSQLGRPYAVQHHLTGKRCEGVHCAEYVTDALMSIGLLHADRPAKVSPASLVTGITAAGIYTAEETIDLTPP
ncbi:MAG: YiiX/YebB-like N1pC/P60 family cysteine hydrolase, partial [Planctomycetaceae bacterium]